MPHNPQDDPRKRRRSVPGASPLGAGGDPTQRGSFVPGASPLGAGGRPGGSADDPLLDLDARSAVENFARGAAVGGLESITSLADLAGAILPGDDPLERFGAAAPGKLREFFDPQGRAGSVGTGVGRFVGEGAQLLLGGAGIAKAGAKVAPKAFGRVAALRTKGPLGKAAATALPFAPVDFAIGAARAKPGENRVAEGLKEVGFGAVAGGTLDLAGTAAGKLAGQAVERLAQRSATFESFVSQLPAGIDLTTREKLVTLWKAGLLSLPKTQLVNLGGTGLFGVLEIAARQPAAFFDSLLFKAVSGERTELAGDLVGELRSIGQTFKRGGKVEGKVFKDLDLRLSINSQGKLDVAEARSLAHELIPSRSAKEALQGKLPPSARFDLVEAMRRGAPMGHWLLDLYSRSIFRTMSATDQLFRGAAMERSLRNQLRVQGHNEFRLSGKRLDEFVEQRLERRVFAEDMVDRAVYDSNVAVFQDNSFFGNLMNRAVEKAPALEFLFPFRTTPGAIIQRVLDYSPFGFMMAGRQITRGRAFAQIGKELAGQVGAGEEGLKAVGKALEAQRKAVTLLGRSTVGSGLLAGGWMLAELGLAAGEPPEFGTRERELFDAEGKQANSVLLGGHWHRVANLAPGGALISLGATLHGLANQRGQAQGIAGATIASLRATSSLFKDQPFFTGMREFVDAFVDPVRGGVRSVEDLAVSVVPNFIRGFARSLDSSIRESDGAVASFVSQLPLLSRALPERLNAFGEPIVRTPGILANMIAPTSPRKALKNPIIKEMSRIGAGVPRMQRRTMPSGEKEPLEVFHMRQRWFGQQSLLAADALINSEFYKQADSIASRLTQQFARIAATSPIEQARLPKHEQELVQAWSSGDLDGDEVRRIMVNWAIDSTRRRVGAVLN